MTKRTFNQSPYFDDYNKSDNIMKVLYRAGRPVQARELNLSDSIVKGQIESFANHIFKNGSKVSNARSSIIQYEYVRLRDNNPDTGETIDLSIYPENTLIKGEVSGLEAKLVIAVNAENKDPHTIYVIYINTAVDGKTKQFIPGENLLFYDENGVAANKATVRCPSCPGSSENAEIFPTGKGHIFSIDEGTFYFEGMFVHNRRQQIIISKYSYPKGSKKPSPFDGKKIGFDFVQRIIASDDDPTLLDPSLGYPNATAPGADRYQVDLLLTARTYDSQDGEGFILLAKMNADYVTEYQKSDSEYAELMDMIAKRTYETNGNYTVTPFTLSWYEYFKKDESDARGWSLNGDKDYIVALMSPAIAYVRGYRHENISDYPVVIKKARDTAKLDSFIKRFDARASMLLKPTTQIVWPNPDSELSIVGPSEVSLFDDDDATGNIIGSCRINDIHYVSGDPSVPDAVYLYAISDLKLNDGKVTNDIKSVGSTATNFKANAVPGADGKFVIANPKETSLVFRLDKSNVSSLRSKDNALNGSMNITVRRKLKASLDSTGSATFSSLTNEFFNTISDGTVCYVTSTGGTVKTIKLDGTNANVAPTSFQVNLGADHAGSTVTIFTDVLKTNQKEKKKTLIVHTYTSSNAPQNQVGQTIMLGKADAYDLKKVELYDHTDPMSPVLLADVTDKFEIVNGSTDWYYGESYVKQNSTFAATLTANIRIHITFRYFDHSGTEGYFTVDSYSDAINDPENKLTFADIPSYTTTGGDKVPLSEAIDFRPIFMGNDTTGTVPSPGSTAIFDIAYYLPRADLIQINKDGLLYVKYGIPSESPVLPLPDQDSMVLYHIFLGAYTYSLDDCTYKFIENKRYTMRDIGRLENRIANVEYYTTLTLLEMAAMNADIKDANGLNRFKNGLIADNFRDFQCGDLKSKEWKAAIDRTHRELRPQFHAFNSTLKVLKDKCVGVKWHGEIATLPYEDVISSENPFATKHLSINHYLMVAKKGNVVLSPQVDTWTDAETLPPVTSSIDTGTESLKNLTTAQGLLGTNWGSWTQQNTTSISTPMANGGTRTTTTTEERRTGSRNTIESRTQSYTIDNVVKDVKVDPYVRSRTVEFAVTNMKPNTQVWVFFDGQNVSKHCRDIGFSLNAQNASTRLNMINYGSDLFTNDKGELRGEFRIPARQFFTGKTKFRVTDDPTGKDPEQETCYAETTYFSGGLDLAKQSHIMNVTSPTFTSSPIAETRSSTQISEANPPPAPPIPPAPAPAVPPPPPVPQPTPQQPPELPDLPRWESRSFIDEDNRWPTAPLMRFEDPMAQQFFVDSDQFITGLDVYFAKIDKTSKNVWIELREMVNGYPGATTLAHKDYTPDQLTSSKDSTVPFHVQFDVPVYLKGGSDYCFVVGGYSPDTRIWIAKMGQEVVDMPGKIVEQQPTIGSSFRSQNNTTWNAEQFETLKYKLYKAKFTERILRLEFENTPQSVVPISLPENPFEMEAGSDLVRVFIPNHGLTKDDRVSLNLFDVTPLKIKCPQLPPQIGQKIKTTTGSAEITSVEKDGPIVGDYIITVKNMTGIFNTGQGWIAEAFVRKFATEVLFSMLTGDKVGGIQVNEATGTFSEGTTWASYVDNKICGVPVTELNTELIVKAVDSIDSFIVQVTTPATTSMRSGGKDVKAFDISRKYETFNVSGSYLAYNTAEEWKLSGIAHGNVGGVFEGENYLEKPDREFKPGDDNSLGQPYKVASANNEIRVFGANGRKSIKVTSGFMTSDENISPVIDCSTFSFTGISNRVEFITPESYNIDPNEANRFIPETSPLNGTEQFKYVTQTVKLENSASDLVIYFDYYKDVNADFEVYVKTIPVYNAKDEGLIEWKQVKIENKKNAADLSGKTECKVTCSKAVADWVEEFAAFKVKIVGKAKNSAKPPIFYDFRAIAVT